MIITKKKAPVKIPEYHAKYHYIARRQCGRCVIAVMQKKNIPMQELHHAAIPNTKANRRRFPLLVHSVWNLIGVSHDLHMTNGSFGRISLVEAERMERFLERHPAISRWMNELQYDCGKGVVWGKPI